MWEILTVPSGHYTSIKDVTNAMNDVISKNNQIKGCEIIL